MKRKIFTAAFAVLAAMLLFAGAALAVPQLPLGGTMYCGDTLSATLAMDGTLTITGTGEMYSEEGQFEGNTSIKKVVIESGCTKVGDSAFKGCSNLESVTLADTVTTIGESAFEGCDKLTAITLPASVDYIWDKAFADSGLETVTFARVCTSMGDSVWKLCMGDAWLHCPLNEFKFNFSNKIMGAEWSHYPNVYYNCIDQDPVGYIKFGFTQVEGWYSVYDDPEADIWTRYYYENNAPVTGWKKIDGSWYYFDEEDGSLTTGLVTLPWKGKDRLYFLNAVDEDNPDSKVMGSMVTGAVTVGGKEYIFNQYGEALTGWKKVSGKWYYYEEGLAVTDDTREVGGKTYAFDAQGVMQTGWVDVQGTQTFFNKYGARVDGWTKINGKWHYIEDGTAEKKSCWFTDPESGKEYRFDENGEMLVSTEYEGKKINKYGVAK